LKQTISNMALQYVRGLGLTMREVAAVIELSPSEVSRTNAGERELSIPQFERLAEHLKIELWQLMLHAMREFDDKAQLSSRVARIAEELAHDLKEVAKRDARVTSPRPAPKPAAPATAA
jgi:transcriptional regulator with XRE-family HTH domain